MAGLMAKTHFEESPAGPPIGNQNSPQPRMSATDLDRLICNRNGTLQTQGEQQTHATQHKGSMETGLWAATTQDEGTLRLHQKCGGHERHILPEPQQLSFCPAKNAMRLVEGKAFTRSIKATYRGRLSALEQSIAQRKIKEQLFVQYPLRKPFWESGRTLSAAIH